MCIGKASSPKVQEVVGLIDKMDRKGDCTLTHYVTLLQIGLLHFFQALTDQQIAKLSSADFFFATK